MISYFGGTFYIEDIKLKIPLKQKELLKQFDSEQKNIEQKIVRLESKLNSAIDHDDHSNQMESFLKLIDAYKKEKENHKPPINLVPYYLNPQLFLWLGVYSACSLLIYFIYTAEKIRFKFQKRQFTLASVLYIFYEWPLWMRNFVLTSRGRTVYAYPNVDIDVRSYFYQELIIFGFCLLSSILICITVDRYSRVKAQSKDIIDINDFLTVSSYYSTSYRNWFINSTLLAIGFLSFTYFFWRLVFVYGDQRYVISAINAHVIWALCWIAISLNLFFYIQQFDKMKRELLRTNPDEKTLKIVMEHQPANNLTIIITGIGSITTFVAPMLKLFFEK